MNKIIIMDKYQERYLAHQNRKKQSLSGKYEKEETYKESEIKTLEKIFNNRNSSRVFSGKEITDKELQRLLDMVETSPSSCDRKGISYKVITSRADKDLLSGLLVGGVGWVNRADKIILLYSDMQAYKSPAEKDFMPYLDAGVMIQSFYLGSEALGLKCCYVNPNVREKAFFDKKFMQDFDEWSITYELGEPKPHLFCGAIVLGK